MQFKNPEILYFLFLLAIPILVHLFQLRRFKKEYFTNVRFLKEISVQTRKSSKIKKWLLLATRLLLLTFLIFAFAQPYIEAKESKFVNNEMFIILDNSFSMQSKGKNGELLKRAVQEILEHTPENTRFSLLTNSDNIWNTDIKSSQKEIQNLTYSPITFNLDYQLHKINNQKKSGNKDIIVITDAVGLQKFNSKNISEEDKLFFILPKAEQKNNVSIDSVYINQTLDNFYEIAIDIKSFGSEIKDVPISLFNKNKLIAKTLVEFKKPKSTVKFTIPKEDFHGFVSISDNSLEYDNNYYFSISKPKKVNVISIGENEKSDFLKRIYTSDEFNFQNFNISNLDYNTIDKQDAIVLNELNEIPQALQTTLKSFIEKGGNIIFIPSLESNVLNINSFLGNLCNAKFKTLRSAEKKITKINFRHPLFNSVFDNKVDNFQYPMTKNSFEINNNQADILTLEDQSPFLTSAQKGVSSLYIFTAPINKNNSNFQNSPLIVPVFYKMAQTTNKFGVNSQIIGKDQKHILDYSLSKDEIVNIKNEKESFIPIQQSLNNKVKLTFSNNPNTAGNFNILVKDKAISNISFNYNRSESDLNQINDNLLSDFDSKNDISTIFNTIQSERTDNQLWKWFIILSLIFITIEILIQKFVK